MNILLITLDQWRGDCLGVAGHPIVRTPNLDRLAVRVRGFPATTARPRRVGLDAPASIRGYTR